MPKGYRRVWRVLGPQAMAGVVQLTTAENAMLEDLNGRIVLLFKDPKRAAQFGTIDVACLRAAAMSEAKSSHAVPPPGYVHPEARNTEVHYVDKSGKRMETNAHKLVQTRSGYWYMHDLHTTPNMSYVHW